MKRSYRHLFMGSLGVALLLANCTVKEDTDDSCEKGDKDVGCDCPGNTEGYQVCGSNGVFGSCICPDGTSGSGNTSGSNNGGSNSGGSNNGGNSGAGGESEGGAPSAGSTAGGAGGASDGGAGGAASEGGAGGEAPFAFADCDECLQTLCADEWDACLTADDDDLCVNQYAAVSACIEEDRAAGNNVTRDRLRGCGVSLGTSPNPDLEGLWAPEQMTDETTNLINCLATSSSELPSNDWADANGPNFPQSGPAPWPTDSCAKLACTSKK